MVFAGCQDLNMNNPSTITPKDLWKDPSLIELYVNHLYIYLPGWDHSVYNNISDEARDNFPGSTPNNILIGEWNETNNPMGNWTHSYKYIRVANDFLAGIYSASVEKEVITLAAAEVRFFRAMLYFGLVKRYGGVPLILEPQQLNSDLQVARNSLDECFDFIVKEMEEIEEDLPLDIVRGKISKGAALSLKARALLYHASPLYNSTGDTERWSKAYVAAKSVMSLNKYSLYPDLKKLWLDMSENHPEIILEKQYLLPNISHGWDCAVKPLTLANGDAGHCSPLQELIDAFPMKSGKSISDQNTDYNPLKPYEGRDDRFYAYIGYNQAVISGMEGGKLNSNYKLNIYKGGNDYDNPSGNPIWQIYTTYTGYFTVKAVDPDNKVYGYWYGSTQPWIEFRYAEILLNFAEAANEVNGPTAEAYDAIDLLRSRAGITNPMPRTLSKEEFREFIRNERYVELCFEHHRYWDLRRWKTAEDRLNDTKYSGVVITKEDNNTFTYNYQSVDATNLKFENRMYFMPIPKGEIAKNKLLIQNEGWAE